MASACTHATAPIYRNCDAFPVARLPCARLADPSRPHRGFGPVEGHCLHAGVDRQAMAFAAPPPPSAGGATAPPSREGTMVDARRGTAVVPARVPPAVSGGTAGGTAAAG